MSDCCGPFARGNPGTGCSCACGNVCPPECCTSVEIHFECGSPATACFPEEDGGCGGITYIPPYYTTPFMPVMPETQVSPRSAPSYDVPNPLAEQPMPVFSQEKIMNQHDPGEMVFSMSSECCSIPCSNVVVTLTPGSGVCCFEIVGETIYAVGGGLVNWSISPASKEDCGALGVYSNQGYVGTVNGSFSVSDAEVIDISVEPLDSNPPGCCECDKQFTVDPCTAGFWYRQGERLFLNKKKLVNLLNNARRAKIQRRMARAGLKGRRKTK